MTLFCHATFGHWYQNRVFLGKGLVDANHWHGDRRLVSGSNSEVSAVNIFFVFESELNRRAIAHRENGFHNVVVDLISSFPLRPRRRNRAFAVLGAEHVDRQKVEAAV